MYDQDVEMIDSVIEVSEHTSIHARTHTQTSLTHYSKYPKVASAAGSQNGSTRVFTHRGSAVYFAHISNPLLSRVGIRQLLVLRKP
jgi:hypothetical protein